jgi:hypothetical protein
MEPKRIECTRAQFAAYFGEWPSPDVIGVCVMCDDRKTVAVEYVFTDEPFERGKFLTRAVLKDIAELERLYKL